MSDLFWKSGCGTLELSRKFATTLHKSITTGQNNFYSACILLPIMPIELFLILGLIFVLHNAVILPTGITGNVK